ncbi:hypothetical protein NDA16_004686 [Ustilago loliicola]|nr:hypothetical protein NDA16_004686 [Ustilago loliicola]
MPAQKRPAPSSASTSKTTSAADPGADQGPNWKKRKQGRAHTARFIETQTAGAYSAGSSRTASKSSTPVPGQGATGASGLPTSIELESLVSSRAFQIQSFIRSIKSAKVSDYDKAEDNSTEIALLDRLHDYLVKAGIAKGSDLNDLHGIPDMVLVQKKADPQGSTTNGSQTSNLSPSAALAPVRVVMLTGTRRFERTTLDQQTYSYDCKEALVLVHPAADTHVRRALKAGGFTMIDENKNALFDLEAPPARSFQAYASQLDSAPDPWLAAGGKDSSLSKLEKRRRRQAFRIGSAKDGRVQAMDTSDNAEEGTVTLDDKAVLMRKQGYNIFELIGPRAAPLLQSVLKVHGQDERPDDFSRLQHLLSKQGKDGVSMVEVRVIDPRLSYPPKLKLLSTNQDVKPGTAKTLTLRSASRDELFWTGAKPQRFSKGEIDSRRARNAIPGARLTPDSRDDIIPVVLIRDTLVQKPQMDCYTLIVPRGWGTAFFLSLVATHQSGASSGARVLGQHQLKHQKLELAALSSSSGAQKVGDEASMLSYPHNWLGTQAYAVSEKEAATVRQEEWSRRPKGKRTEYHFASQKDWRAFVQSRSEEEVRAKLQKDRTGVARPYPFGGSHYWKWIVANSERLFGKSEDQDAGKAGFNEPWLIADPDTVMASISAAEFALSASHLASGMVAIKLHAVRKGTVMPLSSLMLPTTFEDHLSWIHHLDCTDHPALVANRTAIGASKMDKQHLKALIDRRCEIMQLGRSAPPSNSAAKQRKLLAQGVNVWNQYAVQAFDPEEMHNRSADWNNAVVLLVLDCEPCSPLTVVAIRD